MPKPYTRTFRARWSEANAGGHVDLAGYLRYAVETAWDWGAASGLSKEESERLGLAWVIRDTQIDFKRPLYPDDVFDFSIWLVKWRRVRGSRCFELRLQDGGDLVAQGVQQVVTLDANTMRPTSPPETLMANFLVENPRIFPGRQLPKYKNLAGTSYEVQRVVRWGDLDTLEHVNNATYAGYAEDLIAQMLAAIGWSPPQFILNGLSVINRRFHIQYLAPAVWGDTLDIAAYLVELNSLGGSWYIKINRASDGEPVVLCLVEWVLVDRRSGEEQVLPDSLSQSLVNMLAVAG